MVLTSEEIAFIGSLALAVIGAFATVIWWMWTMLVKRVAKNQEDCDMYQNKLTQSFNDHRVEVAKTYAEKSSLERIHDRIDKAVDGIDDIKTFLMGENHHAKRS